MNQSEHNDPVWKLLEHSKRTEPGPYFTRRVMREVKALAEAPAESWIQRVLSSFSPRVAVPAFAAVAAIALVAVFQSGPSDQASDSVNPALVLQIGESEVAPEVEMEAVEYLGQLMAVADPGQLSDDALADLFF